MGYASSKDYAEPLEVDAEPEPEPESEPAPTQEELAALRARLAEVERRLTALEDVHHDWMRPSSRDDN